MPYIIILGGIIILAVPWIVLYQRSLIVLDENINNAIAQMGVLLSPRWDALTSLLELTKGYSELEYNTLTEAIKARRSITRDSTPEDINTQENIIAEVMGRIMTVAEDYPELKVDKVYIKTLGAVNQYENMVQTSRLIYNDCVEKLNHSIRMFPVSMIAGMLGFPKRPYIEVPEEKTTIQGMRW